MIFEIKLLIRNLSATKYLVGKMVRIKLTKVNIHFGHWCYLLIIGYLIFGREDFQCLLYQIFDIHFHVIIYNMWMSFIYGSFHCIFIKIMTNYL